MRAREGPQPPHPLFRTGNPFVTLHRLSAMVAAVLLSCLGLAASAQAAAVPGINISAYDDASVALQQGAKQVRFFVPWKNFEPGSAREFDGNGPVTANPLTTGLKTAVDSVRRSATPILVVLDAPDWAGAGAGNHRHPSGEAGRAAYAAFVGELAEWLGNEGNAPVYEVWNEPDAEEFWGGAPNAGEYTDLLKRSYAAIKAGNPGAGVLSGPTTGNNYRWIEQLYANGAKGSFDGVAVHTDTACSTVGPDVFYREADGRLGQFTFLGYREVRKVMLANGDDKGIWMTEIGWSTATQTCSKGESAGKKPEGVSRADQAAFLTKGFQCMANDPYVVAAAWFTLRDAGAIPYGLFDTGGNPKPSLAAFKGAGGQTAGECGDFTSPALNVQSPTEGQQFVDKLDLRASATDGGVGLGRISFAYDGGKEIRNFTDALTNGAAVGLAPWQGSGALALGAHTVEVKALDRNGNTTTRVVTITKVPAGAVKSTLLPVYKLGKKVRCRTTRGVPSCSLKGSLSRGVGGRPSIGGKVAVEWQWKNKQGKFRKLAGGLKPASKAFTFTAKLKKKGAWRVRVVYKGQAPYKALSSKFVAFRVR